MKYSMEENIKSALELLKQSADLYAQAQKIMDSNGIQFLVPPTLGWCLPDNAKYEASVYCGINKLAEVCGANATHPLNYWKEEEPDKLGFTYNNIFFVQRGTQLPKEYVFK